MQGLCPTCILRGKHLLGRLWCQPFCLAMVLRDMVHLHICASAFKRQKLSVQPRPGSGCGHCYNSAATFVSTMIFTVSARTIGRLGAASAVTAMVIGMNVFANIIVPAQQHLMPFLLWYLLTIIPAIRADIGVNRAGPKMGAIIIPGALIGIAFYVFNFPMLPMTFAELLLMPNQSISDLLPNTHMPRCPKW